MKIKEAYALLREVDKRSMEKKENFITIRLGIITTHMVDKFCKIIGIPRSRYIRIAISFFDSYLSQLSDSELAVEIKKIREFD